MDCEHAAPFLPLVADGLPGLRRWRLRAHLRTCEDCSAKVEEMRVMRAALRDKLAYHEASPDLAARIGAALAREAAPMPA
ncbi:MAG: zf-HC2 domain-containing protein, partial [Acetobacteraceae bacterium]